MNSLQKSGLIYLYLVPPAVAAIGFGIGRVDFRLYLLLWLVNVSLMLAAVSQIAKPFSNHSKAAVPLGWASASILLIIPWMLFSVFAGMGPPPFTISDWVASATEQQFRYTILIIGGISASMGFTLLKTKLESRGERLYSNLGLAVLGLAIPLFILNMVYWGYFLTDAFRLFVNLRIGKRPDWYPPIKTFFYVVSVIEVALTYIATIFFALALKKTGILSTCSCLWYAAVAFIGAVFVVLPPSLPEPFSTAGYLAAIPAIPFMMPYFIGVRLLVHENENAEKGIYGISDAK